MLHVQYISIDDFLITTIPCPIIDVPLSYQSVYRVGKHVAEQKWYLFGCSQMSPWICFLLYPNWLNVSKIIPQNVRDHVYYTGAESKSSYPVAYVWVWVCGCVVVHLLVYLGVCIPDRHRHIAIPTYQHNASTIPTHSYIHSFIHSFIHSKFISTSHTINNI